MKISTISFTKKGSALNRTVHEKLVQNGEECLSYAISRYATEHGLLTKEESLNEWCEKKFQTEDALIFIGATGIAVRAIAPFVKDKRKDPAVIVIDEHGDYVISLLSGHIGGANELALTVAKMIQAIPIITTATDVNHTFAVDVFAKKNNLFISSMFEAKRISAKVLDHEPIGFCSDYPIEGEVDKVFTSSKNVETGVVVSCKKNRGDFSHTLQLIPPIIHLGIGCKRGTKASVVERKILALLEEKNLSIHSLCDIATIDLKKDEEGLLAFSKKYGIPFLTYSAEELMQANGHFASSSFVKSITGVDNVCERSIVYGGQKNGKKIELIQQKIPGDGMTLALGIEDWSVRFE
jgi:cobalt-precorrin 5A hydrolase